MVLVLRGGFAIHLTSWLVGLGGYGGPRTGLSGDVADEECGVQVKSPVVEELMYGALAEDAMQLK
eukprot:3341831-Amphidinium_carterae.1